MNESNQDIIKCQNCDGTGRVFDHGLCLGTLGIGYVFGKDRCERCKGVGFLNADLIKQEIKRWTYSR